MTSLTESLAKHVRKYVFDYFLENRRAPVLEEIMQRFHVDRNQSHSLLKELEEARHVILLPGTQRILMANPFSSLTTPFNITIDWRNYYAACAVDAIAFHTMLGRHTEVDSFCHHCGEPIRIQLSDRRVRSALPKSPLVYISLPAAKWWENIVLTCSNNMVFLSSQEHLDEWLKKNPGLAGEALSIPETLDLGQPIYKEKMKLDYSRPTRDQLVAHWDSIGLRGDFWKL